MYVEHADKEIEKIKEELAKSFASDRQQVFMLIVGAVLGAIPWIGGLINADLNFKALSEQAHSNQLLQQWLEEHEKKMKELFTTIVHILQRLDEFPKEINNRLQSEEYLTLVRKAFRIWDNADTFEKKEIIRKLITNAGAHALIDDDLIRLFLDWISSYHEIHFAVIKSIYHREGITRGEMWQELNGKSVREDSMEADVFKLLIRDLSTGGVIRQLRQKDFLGNYIKKPARKGLAPTNTYKSAFDESEGYELTELGKRFVHYAMSEVVPRIAE